MGHKVACDKTKRGCDEDVEQGNKRLCGGVIQGNRRLCEGEVQGNYQQEAGREKVRWLRVRTGQQDTGWEGVQGNMRLDERGYRAIGGWKRGSTGQYETGYEGVGQQEIGREWVRTVGDWTIRGTEQYKRGTGQQDGR